MNRFIVIGARTMLELVHGMNQSVPDNAYLVYFGRNLGDYSSDKFPQEIATLQYIAVFDLSVDGGDFGSTFDNDDDDNDVVLAA